MQTYVIRQGDQLSIPFPILFDQYILTQADFIDTVNHENDGDIEIVIGDELRKTFKNNEIKFNNLTYTFDFPLTQEETFDFYPGMRLKSQVRLKFRKFEENNFIYSYDGPDIIVKESISGERI